MNSKREGKYFQFPIRALRVGCRLDLVTGEQANDVFNTAIAYAITQRASELLDDERLDVLTDAYYTRHGTNDTNDAYDDDVMEVAAACEVLGVKANQLSKVAVESFRSSWQRIERVPGSNLLVRVRVDLMREFLESWAFRDAAILCGVFAGVGNATYKRLTCERIRTLAMGFASDAERKQHGAHLPMLTDRQVRYTLSQLERRGLFQCATPDGRHKFYSHRLSEPELISVLAQHVAKRERRKTDTKRASILAQAQALIAANTEAAMQAGGR